MPQTKRNGFKEYKNQHIPNSIFFDLDDNSKKDTNLPHMLVDINQWGKILSNMGIKNDDQIVIYDNSDVISSCRCWFNLIYFWTNQPIHVRNTRFTTEVIHFIVKKKPNSSEYNFEPYAAFNVVVTETEFPNWSNIE